MKIAKMENLGKSEITAIHSFLSYGIKAENKLIKIVESYETREDLYDAIEKREHQLYRQ